MATGVVRSIKADRGYGFVHLIGQRDVFFHKSQWQGELEFGEQLRELRVQFDIEQSEKGPRAKNVRPAR